tara:strand:- start:224 stop:391 length:168 start_codon:yes stop_codon:yes gene_type:complete
MPQTTEVDSETLKRREWRMLIFLAVFLAPILAIAIVGGYGFSVWFFQMIYGPPTH